MSRWFTPASARRALRRLRPAVERMRRIYRRLEAAAPAAVVADGPVEPGYFLLIQQLEASVHEIDDAGAVVVDPCRGALDFPARRAGRDVMLCWQVGDRALRYWHESGDGSVRRRRVDEDGPWDPPAGESG